MRMLSHIFIQIVIHHNHDSSCMSRFVRISINIPRCYPVTWSVTVHVDPAILVQLIKKFTGKNRMMLLPEIPQSIFYCQLFLFNS